MSDEVWVDAPDDADYQSAYTWLTVSKGNIPDRYDAMHDALLAVLDECDKIMERIDTPSPRLESTAYLHTGMAVAVNRIRVAIDKALGIGDG